MLANSTNKNQQTEVLARGLPFTEIDNICSLIIANINFFNTEVFGKNYNENKLTQELIIILNQYNYGLTPSLPYIFHPEAHDLHTEDANQERRIDIAVFLAHQSQGRQILFAIEAKRLSNQLPTNREKEYVIGNEGKENGGIQRFKLNHHGKNLSNCGMIGYIEDNTFESWLTKINSWILELKLNTDEKLKIINQEENHSQYLSNHARVDSTNLTLRHIWIKIF